LAFWVWQILAALCIAKHLVYVAWYGALTEPNAMLGVRYNAVSAEEGMVLNLTILPVSLGLTAIFGVFLSMVFSERNPRAPC
jgi:hypothetical protein